LELRSRAINVELEKAYITGVATAVPIVVALFALMDTIWAARKTMIAQFTAKAAELALQGEGTGEVLNRAILLESLYSDLLPADFRTRVEKLDAHKIGRIVSQVPWTSELIMKEVVELLAKYPSQRDQIIKDYLCMFPNYGFLRILRR
jgi:hypothetical protein